MTETNAPPNPSRRLALVVLCAGMLMTILDQTVVNVSLPSIQRDLGFSQSNLAWIVNAYLIAFGGLLLLAGRLGDLVGRKRIFVTGLTVFTLASALCGLSNTRAELLGARFLQGAGGAFTASVILGMIVTMFPEPAEQAKAIGVFSFTAASGGALGLLLGGILTETFSWHWAFFINLPIGLTAVLLAVRFIDHEPGIGIAEGADVSGATLVTGSLMLGVYTIVETASRGWASVHTVGFGALSLLLLSGFVLRQATATHPLLPLRMFRSRIVAGANLAHALMIGGMFGFFFLGAIYLQRVLGYQPIQTGLAFLPVAIAIAAFSLAITPRLITRYGARAVLLPGLLLLVGALLFLYRLPVHGHYLNDFFPEAVLLGVGAALTIPSLMTLAMSAATPADSGLASGLITTSEQVGGAIGLAVLATLSSTRTHHLVTGGTRPAVALTNGFHLAFVVAAGLVGGAVLLALTVLRPDTAAVVDADEAALEPEAAGRSDFAVAV